MKTDFNYDDDVFSIGQYFTPGLVRDMENIRKGLSDGPAAPEHIAALYDSAEILNRIFKQALADSPSCGSFLAELLAFLWKKRAHLEHANYYFHLNLRQI